jgi:hypothetical protein
MIYETDEGFSISSNEVWLPGIYETRAAARFAFQFPDRALQALSDRVCRIDGEHRRITSDDLRALKDAP